MILPVAWQDEVLGPGVSLSRLEPMRTRMSLTPAARCGQWYKLPFCTVCTGLRPGCQVEGHL